jgi:cytochrome c oxidase subunit 4
MELTESKPGPLVPPAPATRHAVDAHDAIAHPVPVRTLVAVFAALLVLTFLTVAVTWVQLGAANIWIALIIAAAKGSLVALYFMHLRWDSPFNAIVLIAALFFVALLLGIVILDSKEYAPNYNRPAAGSGRVFSPR